MSFWNRFFGRATEEQGTCTTHEPPIINPATGLPMIDNSIGGIDVGGSPFGQDTHQWDHCSTQNTFSHDDWPRN